jgi:hypothetical protein
MCTAEILGDARSLKALPAAARALGLAVRVLDVRTAAEFEPAFAAAVCEGLQGLHVSLSPLFYANRTQVTAIAARASLPAGGNAAPLENKRNSDPEFHARVLEVSALLLESFPRKLL